MTARDYVLETVGGRTNEVPTADCAVIVWAVECTLDVVKEIIGPLYDFDEELASPCSE